MSPVTEVSATLSDIWTIVPGNWTYYHIQLHLNHSPRELDIVPPSVIIWTIVPRTGHSATFSDHLDHSPRELDKVPPSLIIWTIVPRNWI
ncbi:hypothetical protein RRG08_053695 [Elysia crispata]|uniref:Uncharacterized protein n=1 Tax=Elysia crispata TaxID=231223 RepID=A0AAE1B9X4_9GAST|nr:hypothetical protein RRG08_053695 [Elysia crispata]